MWALQVQFLLQIIVNRICILLGPSQKFQLKLIVAVWITAINISVYCIWVPAKLQISEKYHAINLYWDRIEKCLYLVTDAILNYMFVRIIRKRLVAMGLRKYDKLVSFNEKIIVVSLAMDVLIIGMMSYRNDFVYMQFHPVAYMVKLEIEMCMSHLMVKVATGTGVHVYEGPDNTTSNSGSGSNSNSNSGGTRDAARRATYLPNRSVNVHVATQVITHTDHELEDQEAHELEERDTKQYALGDADLERGQTNAIDLVPEDDQESTRTGETTRKQKALEASTPWTESSDGSYIEDRERERRGVTFNPDVQTAPGSRPRTGDSEGGVFVSYLGTPNVRVLHSTGTEGP